MEVPGPQIEDSWNSFLRGQINSGDYFKKGTRELTCPRKNKDPNSGKGDFGDFEVSFLRRLGLAPTPDFGEGGEG